MAAHSVGVAYGVSGQARVGQGDRAAFPAAAHRDQVAGAGGQRVQVAPPPDVGHRLGGRDHRHQVRDLGPQRDQVLAVKIPVQLLELGSFFGRRLRSSVPRGH